MKVTLAGGAKFHAAARDLRRAKGNLRRDLAQALRAAAEPLTKDLQRQTLTADMRGYRGRSGHPFTAHVPSKGVRRPMSRAITSDVSTAAPDPRARVILNADKVPLRIRALIKYFAGAPRLRHPLMGNREHWFGQRSPNVWHPTINKHVKDFERRVGEALDKVRQTFEGRR